MDGTPAASSLMFLSADPEGLWGDSCQSEYERRTFIPATKRADGTLQFLVGRFSNRKTTAFRASSGSARLLCVCPIEFDLKRQPLGIIVSINTESMRFAASLSALRTTGSAASRARARRLRRPHCSEAGEHKFRRMLDFGAALPSICARVNDELARLYHTRKRVFAIIDPLGHSIRVTDRRLARRVRRRRDSFAESLVQYRRDDGMVRAIDSTTVNRYMREIAGNDFTVCDVRTWACSLLAMSMLVPLVGTHVTAPGGASPSL